MNKSQLHSPAGVSLTEIIALIPAAGIGSRMKSECPKQYLKVAGKTILEHTLAALFEHPRIQRVIIALNPADTQFAQLPIASDPRITTVIGGEERADSVLAGLDYLAGLPTDRTIWVLVHDAARPCLHRNDLDSLLRIIDHNVGSPDICGGLLASPVRDTMKRMVSLPVAESSTINHTLIAHTVDRNGLWHALTPQLFPLQLLRDCLIKALADQACITDESSALEHCGYRPMLINGRADNIKVTQPEDLALAEFYLSQKAKESIV
ncbi:MULTISPECIES: 2-C-methyl-D-erythritol 4-phosphate cytidylyltransferase [Xenorhabdus]|uniref:2-C-methyl-D-erythritol 4-phosphate cytidylyltransferase n=1 Tax=Xenorhabdus ehlersii TaxID=290111 RepID=A0A2D0IVI5_9GAMM|nr:MULTISPECIES: 2-C-methyl-D-erythritol 4-phosphate cytidylyltransferase [Xenorhabdus]MBC8949827.1 bifunctional ribulose 5-phosphate reductase CDP-ribitol pyrophosphorylase [Xenorhabdus sp. TS4]PHM25899.1 bifunctional ribulose 5-phosphate reductase CDP-ribitol pyrophosphorylase [Xenorhabdus ehlersii]RKE88458.1 2-C-methyl-D-erythritol 4-phosphate cytidylyltransferase [Xenorhabdus ehlersii]